jgi:hypothetical protein
MDVITKWRTTEMLRKVEAACTEAVEDGVELLLPLTQSRCPVLTGALKATGRKLKLKTKTNEISQTIRYGGARARYAIYVEAKKPYLRPPVKENEQNIVNNFEGKLK